MKKFAWITICLFSFVFFFCSAIADMNPPGGGTDTGHGNYTDNTAELDSGTSVSTKKISKKNALPAAMMLLVGEPEVLTRWPFPDTGQTKCYDNEQEITCPQPGERFYGQDAQYPRIPRSYTKLGNGGVVLSDNALHGDDGGPWIMTRDNVTGLIWEVKTDADKNDTYTWEDAQSVFIQQLNAQKFGGFSDWRLPEVKELSSLVNRGLITPAIDVAWFPKTMSSDYWSSTTLSDYTDGAWYVHFSNGYINAFLKSLNMCVRAVRSGQ